MPVQTTALSGATIQQILQSAVDLAVEEQLIYAQSPLAVVPPGGVISRGNNWSTLAFAFANELPPNTTAISETADITPRTVRYSSVVLTLSGYADAVQLSKPLEFQATPDVVGVAGGQVSRQLGRTIDYLARSQAIGGNSVVFGGDAVSRATVSNLATADQLAFGNFLDAIAYLDAAPKLPGMGMGAGSGIAAITRRAVLADLIEDGTLIVWGQQGDPTGDWLLNGEIGRHVSGVRIIESNFAKIFNGAGGSGAATSNNLLTPANALSTSMGTSAALSSDGAGTYLTVGTIESTANGEQAVTEVVLQTGSSATTTITFVGAGANGGLKYDHSSGVGVTHAYQVYTTLFMGAEALMKGYAGEWGEFGQVLPPDVSGLAKQFNTMAWHWYGGFARKSENRLFRIEHSAARYTLGN